MDKFIKILVKYWDLFFIKGISTTLLLTSIGVLVGLVGGILLALPKQSLKNYPAKLRLGRRFPRPMQLLSWLCSAYVEIIRGTPILLQLYFFYLALPEMLSFLNPSKFTCVALALSCNSAAYISEIIRSGIQAVDRGQTEAARSLGLSSRQTMRRIVLPQAVKNILPSMVNEFASLLKESSLASTFFVGDLMTQYKVVSGALYLPLQPLILVGIIYFICTFVLSKIVGKLEKRLQEGD